VILNSRLLVGIRCEKQIVELNALERETGFEPATLALARPSGAFTIVHDGE